MVLSRDEEAQREGSQGGETIKGIVTLCGSTRFKGLFAEASLRLTMADWCVLSVGSFAHSDAELGWTHDDAEVKRRLDRLHKEKIDISQAIVVLNGVLEAEAGTGTPGYIGDSTKSEVEHARKAGKVVYWWDVKAAMMRLVNREGTDVKREPWDWDGGDQPWEALLK